MRRHVATMVGVGLVLALAAPALAEIAPPERDPEVRIGVPDEPERLAGADRFASAASIALYASRYGPNPDRVYLARADQFADALAAGTLEDGPTLFVPSQGEVPSVVLEVITALDPGEVVALGGPNAIADQVLRDAADGRPVDRLAGTDRFATAVAIATYAWAGRTPTTVYVARADLPVDALAGGFLTDGPVLLLPPAGPAPDVVRAAIADLDPEQVVRLGGEAAIEWSTVQHAAAGRSASTLNGEDRFETAAAISRRVVPDDFPVRNVYLARADVFADAVVAGALSDGVLLLTQPCGDLPAPTAERLAQLDAHNVVALGGPAAVCDATLDSARQGLDDVWVSGADRGDDRTCTDGEGATIPCTDATLGGEILEAWVEDTRAEEDGRLAMVVRLPSLFRLPDDATPPSLSRFAYEDPDSEAAIRFETDGVAFDVEVLGPDGTEDQDASSKYKSDCYVGGASIGGTNQYNTATKSLGSEPSCFEEVDPDTWELTVELTTQADGETAVDTLTIRP